MNETVRKEIDQVENEIESSEEEKRKKLLILIEENRQYFLDIYGSDEKVIMDRYDRIVELIEKGDFYSEQIGETAFERQTVHEYFFTNIPERQQIERSGYSDEDKNVIAILKLMEEITPVQLEQFFSGTEIMTETEGSFPLNDQVDVRMHLARENPDQVCREESRSYMKGGEAAYKIDHLQLMDKDGQVIHDFTDDMPTGTSLRAGTRWQAWEKMPLLIPAVLNK